jgi:hypothetical protein
MIKMMMAAAGLSLGLLMMPIAATTPAKAGVNIDINIGGKKQISCGRGRRLVQDYGYFDVRPRDCNGRNYSYFGRRGNGRAFIITVDSRRARVVDVRRLYY